MNRLIVLLLAMSTWIGFPRTAFAETKAPELRVEEVLFRDGAREWSYQKRLFHGWPIYIEKRLVQDEALLAEMNAELEKSLTRIEKVVPKGPVAFLKATPIWVSNEKTYPLRDGEKGVVVFHRSKEWLGNHGLNPHMAPGVHLINPKAVLREHRVFEWAPMTILHELSHAYHNLHLGLDHPLVKSCYQNAMATQKYLSVPDRTVPSRKARAYASTNQQEYFAELTEAYFGVNDWYPRNRNELKEYDPRGCKMIEKVWEIRGRD